MTPPAFDHDLRLPERVEDFAVKQFVPQAGVEGLNEAVLPWTSRRDVRGLRAVARIEATRLGLDIRFVVTNIEVGTPAWIYDELYCARGQAENLIKRDYPEFCA